MIVSYPLELFLSRPVNVNGAYRVNGSLNYGFGIKENIFKNELWNKRRCE